MKPVDRYKNRRVDRNEITLKLFRQANAWLIRIQPVTALCTIGVALNYGVTVTSVFSAMVSLINDALATASAAGAALSFVVVVPTWSVDKASACEGLELSLFQVRDVRARLLVGRLGRHVCGRLLVERRLKLLQGAVARAYTHGAIERLVQAGLRLNLLLQKRRDLLLQALHMLVVYLLHVLCVRELVGLGASHCQGVFLAQGLHVGLMGRCQRTA